ncbi:MAG: hypothetical protein II963_03055, partial [Bacteroidales bacterium]|nr:hypothetical protein [Bacteroidales bacterium]
LTPQGCLPLIKSDLPEEIVSLETSNTALVSFFENQGGKYIAVVNSSCKQNFALDVEFADMAYTIDRNGDYSEQQPGKKHFIIDDGDMLVIKYR